MNCGQCRGIEIEFGREEAARKLRQYRAEGPTGTTRLLIEALTARGIAGKTVLDVGGGVGVIPYELLKAGASQATLVEASTAYVEAAREEARRRGVGDRVRLYHDNFVDLAPRTPPADIVTLDRVICCYPDMEALVRLSAERAREYYGLVYPRDSWWTYLTIQIGNLGYWLRRIPFRVFLHPAKAVDALVRAHGLRPQFSQTTFLWQVVVYSR